MHYFWPTSPLTLARPRGRAAQPAVPDGRRTSARLGQQPGEPGQPVRAEGAAVRRRPHRARAHGQRRPAACSPRSSGTRRATRPASAAASPTSCARSSASRSRPTRRTGKGRLAVDNVGVQYGLLALQRGEITPEQFADLNAKVGGIDIDGNFIPQRTAADPDALRIVYETGRINSGTGAADIPEIDTRIGNQGDDTGFHPAFHSFTYRARLDKANGHHDNQVIWLSAPGRNGAEPVRPHAQVARHRHQAGGAARHVLHGQRCAGRPDLQRDVDVLPRTAARRGVAVRARRRQVPAEAALTGGLRSDIHRRAVGAVGGRVPDRRVRLRPARREPSSRRRRVG